MAAAQRRRADSHQPHPRHRSGSVPVRRCRDGTGDDVEQHPGIRSRGHRGSSCSGSATAHSGRSRFRTRRPRPGTGISRAGEAERFPRQRRQLALPVRHRRVAHAAPASSTGAIGRARVGTDEITEERNALHVGDPYAEQLRHFVAVIEGKEQPVCSAADAMRSLETTVAVAEAAAQARSIRLSADAPHERRHRTCRLVMARPDPPRRHCARLARRHRRDPGLLRRPAGRQVEARVVRSRKRPDARRRSARSSSTRSRCAASSPISRWPIARPDAGAVPLRRARRRAFRSATLWRLAPVLNAVRLTRPTHRPRPQRRRHLRHPGPDRRVVQAVRRTHAAVLAQQHRDRRTAPSRSTTACASAKVALANLAIGIPFLSSLPHDAEIRVNPRFEGALDGARFTLKGTTSTPFADRKEADARSSTSTRCRCRGYVQYVPLPQGLKLADGALTTRLKLAFVSEKGEPRTVDAVGHRAPRPAGGHPQRRFAARRRALDRRDARQARSARARGCAGERRRSRRPDVDLRRGADGVVEFQRLLRRRTRSQRARGAAPAARASAAPWTYSVADLHVAGGTVRVADEGVSPAFRVALSNVKVDATEDCVERRRRAPSKSDFDSESGAHFGATGNLDIAKGAARGHFALTKFRLAELYPYYADAVNLDVQRGELDLAGDFDAAWSGDLAAACARAGQRDAGRPRAWRCAASATRCGACHTAISTASPSTSPSARSRSIASKPGRCRCASVRQADGVVNFRTPAARQRRRGSACRRRTGQPRRKAAPNGASS